MFKMVCPLSTILGFHGLKNPQSSLVCQPQGYGLSLIKFAEQSIRYSFVPLQAQEMVGESLNQHHYSSGAIQEPYCISTPLFIDIILNTLENQTIYFTKQLKESWGESYNQNTGIQKTLLTNLIQKTCCLLSTHVECFYQHSSCLSGSEIDHSPEATECSSVLLQFYHGQMSRTHRTLKDLHVPAGTGAPQNMQGGAGHIC